jgi:hypothetical protein
VVNLHLRTTMSQQFVKCEYANHYYPKGGEEEHNETCMERSTAMSKKSSRAGRISVNSQLPKILNKSLFTAAQLTPTELGGNASKEASDDESSDNEAVPPVKIAKLAEAISDPNLTYLTIEMFLV